MKNIKITENDLQSYVDGRVDSEQAEKIEQYLQQNPSEAKRIAAYRQQNELLHSLYDNTEDSLTEQYLSTHTLAIKARSVTKLSIAASVAWLALGTFIGWGLQFAQAPVQTVVFSLPQTAIAAHAVYSPEVRHPVEVGADQEEHLVKWLSKRLKHQLQTPDLSSLDYSLIGGRLLPADVGPAAQFMYENSRGERLTLYVIAQPRKDKDTAFRFFENNNIKVFYWTDANMGFAISGAIDKGKLLEAANSVYTELVI